MLLLIYIFSLTLCSQQSAKDEAEQFNARSSDCDAQLTLLREQAITVDVSPSPRHFMIRSLIKRFLDDQNKIKSQEVKLEEAKLKVLKIVCSLTPMIDPFAQEQLSTSEMELVTSDANILGYAANNKKLIVNEVVYYHLYFNLCAHHLSGVQDIQCAT